MNIYRLLKNNYIFLTSLAILFITLLSSSKSESGYASISDSVFYLVQARAYAENYDGYLGFFNNGPRGLSIALAGIYKLFGFENWRSLTSINLYLSISSLLIMFSLSYLWFRKIFLKRFDAVLYSLFLLVIPSYWFYTKFVMTEVFFSACTFIFIFSSLYIFRFNNNILILIALVFSSFFFLTTKTIGTFSFFFIFFVFLLFKKDKKLLFPSKYIYIFIIFTVYCFIKVSNLNDLFRYDGTTKMIFNSLDNFDFYLNSISYILFVFYLTLFHTFPLALYNLKYEIINNYNNKIHFLLLIVLTFVPLSITAITGASWKEWGHYRGFFGFIPSIYFVSITLLFTICKTNIIKIPKFKEVYLILISISGIIIYLINIFYFRFVPHGWDFIHLPIYNSIYLTNFQSIAIFFIPIICFFLFQSFKEKSLKKIVCFSLLPSFIFNIYIIISDNMNSFDSWLHNVVSEKEYENFSKYIKDKYQYDELIMVFNNDESFTIHGYFFIMDNWKNWRQIEANASYVTPDLIPTIPSNSLLITKEKIINLILLEKLSVNNVIYYVYKNFNSDYGVSFSLNETKYIVQGNYLNFNLPIIYFSKDYLTYEISLNFKKMNIPNNLCFIGNDDLNKFFDITNSHDKGISKFTFKRKKFDENFLLSISGACPGDISDEIRLINFKIIN